LSWREALYAQIYPSIRQALQRIDSANAQWASDYQTAIADLLKLVTMDLENLAEKKSQLLAEQVTTLVDGVADSKTLSQKVLRIYLAFPAIASVLVGMRTPKYVADALSAGEAVPTAKAHDALLRLQRYRS
jgi:aryl-alcohol dehydrogenase-like predicted oxidoreductase